MFHRYLLSSLTSSFVAACVLTIYVSVSSSSPATPSAPYSAAVNNEIGVVQPLKAIGELCRENKVFFHTDAAQAVGKIPIDVEDMKAGSCILQFTRARARARARARLRFAFLK